MNGPPQKPTTACSGRSSRAHERDRVEDGRQRLVRVGHAQALDRRGAPDRIGDDGADALDELDLDAHRGDRAS